MCWKMTLGGDQGAEHVESSRSWEAQLGTETLSAGREFHLTKDKKGEVSFTGSQNLGMSLPT